MNATRTRAKKIFQTAAEVELLVKAAARIKQANPELPWGRLMIQASNEALPANRRCPEAKMLQYGKAKYKHLVEAEIEAQVAESLGRHVAERAAVEKISAEVIEPTDSGLKMDAGTFMGWMDTAADMMAQEFKAMLLARFRPVASEVFSQIGKEIEGGVGQTFFSDQVKEEKLKIAFVGNATDNLYFQKIAHGFEEMFEFVPVQTLKDARKLEGCTTIMFSSTASPMLVNAAKAINGAADMMVGKGSPELRTYLWKSCLTDTQRAAFNNVMPSAM